MKLIRSILLKFGITFAHVTQDDIMFKVKGQGHRQRDMTYQQ